jgi:hypothetical protein
MWPEVRDFMSTGLSHIIDLIRREIEVTENRLTALRRELNNLSSLENRSPQSGASVYPTQFAGKPVGASIREFLALKPEHSALVHELVEPLEAGGCELGKYPKRSISLAIKNSPDFLERKDGLVYLK